MSFNPRADFLNATYLVCKVLAGHKDNLGGVACTNKGRNLERKNRVHGDVGELTNQQPSTLKLPLVQIFGV